MKQDKCKIAEIRAHALDSLHKESHGIGALFQENFRAAESVLYEDGNRLMRTGHLAKDYAEGFAKAMGMTPERWAGWIVEQNRKIVQRAYAIEKRYLELIYGDSVITDKVIEEYKSFCEAI